MSLLFNNRLKVLYQNSKVYKFLCLILLQFSLITSLFVGTSSVAKAQAVIPGLVAAYGFEEGTGSVLNDLSGNLNNGVLQNGPLWVTNGKYGKALQFDGSNDLVTIPDSDSLDLTTGMTLEAWVYPTATLSGWDTVLLKEQNNGLVYSLYANGDSNIPYGYLYTGGSEYGASGTSKLSVNVWTHLALTYDGNVLRFFVNGMQVRNASRQGSIQTSTRGIGIGGNMVWRDESFPGLIDEVRIYNRALTASEISFDMQTPISDGIVVPVSPSDVSTIAGPSLTLTRTPTPTKTLTRTPTLMSNTPSLSTFTSTSTLSSGSDITPLPTSFPGLFTGPLSVSIVNPRYFADPNGKVIFLTGSHTWCNFMDCDDVNPISTTFNYPAYLDFLISNNHNFFRLWRAENARGGEIGSNFWFDPMPYQRSSTCCAFDGGNKFDLSQFNQAYFDRMRSRIIDAGNRGIYVSIMLFDGWSIESKTSGHQPWTGHPYNGSNNINNINGDTNNDNQGGETHTLSNSYITTNITPLQEAYVRKVIDTVNDLDNVLYEISNESSNSTSNTTWQYHMINYIKIYEAGKPKRHPVGMTVTWPNGDNSVLSSSPADWISPNGDVNNPPTANGSKVVLSDTDHLCGLCGNRQWVWKSFTRGENPIFMDPYDGQGTGRGAPSGYNLNNANDVSLRKNLGYARTYATRIDLLHMTPQPSLCSTGYCLANAVALGAEYLAYLPSGGSIDINLVATQGSLTVEWFNPATGTVTTSANITGGATRHLTAPFSGDAVLYIKAILPPTSTPSEVSSATFTLTSASTSSPLPVATQTLNTLPSYTSTRMDISTPSATLMFTPTITHTVTMVVSPSYTSTNTSIPSATSTFTSIPSFTPSQTRTPSQTATSSSSTGLVAAYGFNNNSGTVLTDSSGNNNNGTLTNGPTWTINGKYGSALTFDGTNDKVVVPDSNSLDLVTQLTLEAWVYPTSVMSGWDTILMKEQQTNLVYSLYANGSSNRPYGNVYINSEHELAGVSALSRNTWTHIALTYDGAMLKFYINGQLVKSMSQTGTLPMSTGVLSIGGNGVWPGETFAGRIDEIRIYNRALPQQIIQTDMNTPIN